MPIYAQPMFAHRMSFLFSITFESMPPKVRRLCWHPRKAGARERAW